MTYREIRTAIEAYAERQKADMQLQAVLGFRQAHLIGALVARIMGSKQKPPELQESYPGIFPDEMFERKQDWRIMKERVASYGDRRRKRGEQRGNDR